MKPNTVCTSQKLKKQALFSLIDHPCVCLSFFGSSGGLKEDAGKFTSFILSVQSYHRCPGKPQSETVGEGGACQHFNSLKDAQLVALFIVSWSFYLKEIIHNHSKIYSLVNY